MTEHDYYYTRTHAQMMHPSSCSANITIAAERCYYYTLHTHARTRRSCIRPYYTLHTHARTRRSCIRPILLPLYSLPRVYVWMYAWICMCVCVCMFAYIYIYVCVNAYICLRICICVGRKGVCLCVCVGSHMYMCGCVHMSFATLQPTKNMHMCGS